MENELLAECPGVVGDVARAIDKSLTFSEPMLSLGTAFSVVGALKSGRFACGGIQAHAYHAIVARAGLGKSRAQDLVMRVCEMCDESQLITGDATSEAGILNSLSADPRRLMVIDEIGRAFEQMGADVGGYRQEVLSVLLKMYSCADSAYYGKNYASKEPIIIHRPLVSVLGGSTPHAFFAGMTPRLVYDGMLSRFFLWFASGDSMQVQPGVFEIDIEPLLEIKRHGVKVGNVSQRHIPQQIVPEDAEEFERTCFLYDISTREKKDDLESALYARAKEQFVKLCIALADTTTGLVRNSHLHYAGKLLGYLFAQTLERCLGSLGDSNRDVASSSLVEQIYKFIVSESKNAVDKKVTASQISRKFQKGKLREEALRELISQERIFITLLPRNRRLYSIEDSSELNI